MRIKDYQLLLIFLLFLPYQFLFAGTRVSVEMGGLIGSVDDPRNVLLAGSMGTIAISILPYPETDRISFKGFPETKPDWLSLEFTYSNDGEICAIVSSELLSQINPQYYLEERQVGINSIPDEWNDLPNMSKRLVYFFSYRIPEELVGKRLCVRPVLTLPPYGPVVSYEDPSFSPIGCITIKNPDSKEDSNRVHTSQVISANRTRNYQRTVQLADSLLRIGWTSLKGLSAAKSAAMKISDYESALLFLDTLYDRYDSPYPRLIPKDHKESLHQSEREMILRYRSEQEQQLDSLK